MAFQEDPASGEATALAASWSCTGRAARNASLHPAPHQRRRHRSGPSALGRPTSVFGYADDSLGHRYPLWLGLGSALLQIMRFARPHLIDLIDSPEFLQKRRI